MAKSKKTADEVIKEFYANRSSKKETVETAREKLNKKYGITGNYTSATTKSNNKPASTKTDKGKQNNSASPTKKTADEVIKEFYSNRSAISSNSPFKTNTTKKYSDYNTDTKNAYTSVKDRMNSKTTIKSNLTDNERNKRIKEIKSELTTLNTKLSGYSRAKAYGTSKAMLEAEENDKKRMAELSQELKTLERVGTFSASELKQFEIDDAKAKKRALPTYNPTARITLSEADALKENVKKNYVIDKEIDRLEREKAEYKRIERLDELNAHTAKITSQKDFKQNSKYTPLAPKTDAELKAEGYKLDKEGKWYKTYGFGNRESYTGEDSDTYTYINDPSKRLSIETDIQLITGENTYRLMGYHTLTDEEKGAYNYLYHQDRKNGTKTAEKYLSTISPLLQERAMALEAQSYKEIAKDSPVAMSALSLGTNLQNAMMYPAKLAATATGSYDDLPLLDMYGNKTQAIRGGVSEDMPYWGNLLYNGAMSIGDMGVAMAASGGNPTLMKAIMSSSAGSSSISNAKKNGASDGKALVLGLGSAAIEWATERYSVEAILKKPETILGYIGANTLTEATEEGASNVANIALDSIVSEVFGERSEIEQRVDYLVLFEGKTEEEALSIAFNEKLQSLGEDVLLGGFTGFGMSAPIATTSAISNKIENTKTKNEISDTIINDEESLNALIEEGKANGTASAKIAEEVEQAKENGTLTKSQVKKLISANEKAIKTEESTPDPLEQTAREVVEERNRIDGLALLEARRNGNVTPQMLERLSQVNAEITNEEAKKATGFGDKGAELVAKAVNTDGATFYQTVAEVRPSYLAGFNNPDMDIKKVAHTFDSQAQQDAYTAGQQDAVMQNTQAEAKARSARVFGAESGVIENENSAQYSPRQMRMADTIGKDLGAQVSFEERLLANEETGYEANAYHQNGEIKISNNSENKFIEDIMEESLHRMSEIDTEAVRVLKRATYEFITEIERSKGTEGITFDEEKALYDNAGQSINTRGIMEEVSVGTLSRELFKDEKQWLKWRERLDTDSKLRQAWYKLMDIVSEIIAKIERLLAEKSFSKETRAKVNKEMAELKRLKGLYTDAYVATRDAVAEKTNNQNTETRTEATQSPVASESKSVNKETPSKPKNKPQTKSKAVKVGETYTANATGKTYTITERSDTHTTYTVTDKNGKTTTRKITNTAADINFNRAGEEGFTKVKGSTGIKVGDVFTAKGTTYKIVSRDAMNTKVEISSKEGTQTMLVSNEVADNNFINMSKEGITKWIDEDMHIDNRTWEDVGDRKVKAFQFLFPEMKEYYTPLAQELLGDLDNTIEGERIKIGSYDMNNEEWVGVSRYTSEAIATIKDSTNATYDDIRNALNRLINDEGEENIALAKRIELVFDDMLTNGYTTFDGTEIEANEEYITKKEALIGKTYEKYVPSEDEELPYFSLKNKNLTINSRIPFTVLNNYINVAKGDKSALGKLVSKVSNLKRGTYKNDATGYKADINADTIRKAIHPTHNKFNPFTEEHIRNLNAMLKLPELFKKAVYVDTKPPQKSKNKNKAIKGFHHFVAPLFMDNGEYRAIIRAREKVNSNILYVLSVEVLPTQKRHTLSAAQQKNAVGSQWLSVPSNISIPELVNGVKIKNYDTNTNTTYTSADIQFSLKQKAPTFYSQMAKTIEGIKQDKIGANSVVSYLTGRGVKAEEIKWSGIETFLEGKKSVTKAELQEFVAGSMLDIGVKTIEDDIAISYTQDELEELDRDSKLLDKAWAEANDIWNEAYGTDIPADIMGNDDAPSAMIRYVIDQHGGIRNFEGISHLSDAERKIYDDYSENSITRKIKDLEEHQAYIAERAKARRDNTKQTKYHQYTLDGGSGNYRELLFKMPNSEYTNQAMSFHWGEGGILAHARVQDFDVNGQKMLFIEEIQSDWHNEGQKRGYQNKLTPANEKAVVDLREKQVQKHNELKEVLDAMDDISSNSDLWDKAIKLRNEEQAIWKEIQKLKGIGDVTDAPFRNNYHEYVLKNLLRMAAEDGYDSIGWTTADIQSQRWSDKFAEGYRIEYDQDIPKFLNKYGKKWGAKVGKTEIGKVDGGWYEVEGTEVWSMPITDSMKDSVLYEGQPMFSLKKAVEQTKNLIAVHNSTEEKLIQAVKLGGLPSPSIAITKNDVSHEKFGDISLVFRKDSISPTDRRNKIYSGDAYTPTGVRVEYDVDDDVLQDFNKRLKELTPEWAKERLPSVDSGTAEVENDSLYKAYERNDRAKFAFLREKGKAPKIAMRTPRLSTFVSNDTVIALAKAFTAKQLSDIANTSDGVKQYKNAFLKVIRDNEDSRAVESGIYSADEASLFDIAETARVAKQVKENKYKIAKEIDLRNTFELIDKKFTKALKAEYKAWIDENTKDAIIDKGIRNNRDLFTPSGNRRSFKQLHEPYNLSNIVKQMFSGEDKGIALFGGSPIGAAQHEYSSIDEVKADSGRIQQLEQEEYDRIRNDIEGDINELANKMKIRSDIFAVRDLLAEAIGKKTKQQADSHLKRESEGWANYSPEFTNELWDIRERILNMPTEYFESKPQRAVSFNEVALAVLPKGKTALRKMLEDAGVQKVVYYDKTKDGDRLAKVNSAPDINFSLKGGISPMELLNTIGDAQKGKKGAAEKLAKYVESGMIRTKTYDELVEKYGVIPSGERPHREVQVPRKTGKNKKVSQTVRTILEAKATPDEAVPTIEKMVEDGIFSYDVYTDKAAISDAEDYIKEYGWDESLEDWFDAVNKGEVSKELTTMGWALYNNAANIAATTTSETEKTTAIKTSLKILDAMVRHQRSAAQALQATRILKKLSPETQLYGVQKSVQALQNELTEKYGDKAPNLTIDEELAEQFINAKTPEERTAIEEEIYKDIGRQMPSRFIDKWNAWRYLAMLGNVRTHVRNLGGNLFFAPVVGVKNLTATAIESAVYRVSGKKTIRGKALVWGNKTDRALLKAAWDDYGNVADMISNGGKYNDSAMTNKHIQDGRRIFKFKPLEWARKKNSELLEKEDTLFSKPHYAYALAQYCKANNITPEQISRGKAIAPAREYAIREAQKATYRDTNAFSQMVSEWGRSNKSEKNVVKKAFNTVIEGILPFRKTPANILVRGVEYSPLGLLKGLSYDLYQVSKGKMTASEAIDNISAGLTGTGLLALGVLLAAQGLVRGHGEDEEEKKFKELMGHQAYSLELPNGQSITLDWLAPEALPFFVGVNLWETSTGSEEEVNLSAILQSVSHITEPMLEMSCLQGLNDLFEGIGYASSNDTSGLVSVVSSAVTSYLTQGIPTLSGQAERTGEEERMTTYTEKNDFLTGDMQYTLGKASAKIPFWDYNQIPYIDAWGRREASGTALKRGLNNFLNPAYTSTIDTSYMEEELLRLYDETGESGVFPSRADKYFTVDGERKDLTADEYVRYATLKGEKSYKAVTDLVNSRAYKKLSDEEKAKAVKEAYEYANQKAKQTISNYEPEAWVGKADDFSNVGNYLSFRAEVSDTKKQNGEELSKEQIADIALDMAQNDAEVWKMYLSTRPNGGSESDLYAYDMGIDGETYMYFIESLNEVDTPTKSGKYGTYTQDEAKKAVNQLDGLSKQEKSILWQSVNTGWKKNPFR